jgi:hypothetical protein
MLLFNGFSELRLKMESDAARKMDWRSRDSGIL